MSSQLEISHLSPKCRAPQAETFGRFISSPVVGLQGGKDAIDKSILRSDASGLQGPRRTYAMDFAVGKSLGVPHGCIVNAGQDAKILEQLLERGNFNLPQGPRVVSPTVRDGAETDRRETPRKRA